MSQQTLLRLEATMVESFAFPGISIVPEASKENAAQAALEKYKSNKLLGLPASDTKGYTMCLETSGLIKRVRRVPGLRMGHLWSIADVNLLSLWNVIHADDLEPPPSKFQLQGWIARVVEKGCLMIQPSPLSVLRRYRLHCGDGNSIGFDLK